jgi:hypothetical protein
MNNNRVREAARGLGVGLSLAATLLSIAVLAAPAPVRSAWRTQPIAVDGLSADWTNTESLERGPAVGAVNDDEFLHLVVSSKDPAVGGPLLTGLIVWIDPAGRRAQTFGIRVPGVEMAPLPGMTPAASANASPGVISTKVFDRFDVLGPGQNQRRLVDITPGLGVELASGYSDSDVTYELKIPLQKTVTRMYAVGAGPGRTVGLGIATPEAPRNAGARQRLVGSDGFIGGHPWFAGGFASYREPDGRTKPVEVWTTLTLAGAAP